MNDSERSEMNDREANKVMQFIDPDINLIEYLRKDCNSAISTCMQCGSCTAVCELSPEDKPFPRKEMIWASWGLRDKLLGDPDIWLCHQCGDCTVTCPRDVRPGDVIASLRSYHYLHYARPRFLGRWLHSPRYLPLIILIPALVIAGIIALTGSIKMPEGPVNYSTFFPHIWLNVSFFFFVVLFYGIFISGIMEFLREMKQRSDVPLVSGCLWRSIWQVLKEILTHQPFRKCTTNRFRYTAHFLVFWGFVLLLVVTLFAILSTLLFEYPLPFLNPIKIAGNLGGMMLVIGLSIMISMRLFNRRNLSGSNYFDWFFPVALLLLTLSGGAVEIARFQNWTPAYLLYFIHLVLVWIVILYAPYSKFGHFVFRTAALVAARQRGRQITNKKLPLI